MSQSALALAPAVIITVVDGIPTTTSADVARHFGKRHDAVLRDVRGLLDQLDAEHAHNFVEMFVSVDIGNGATRQSPAYRLTRDGFTLLAMGFTGKKALQFKLAYIDAFNRMEAELSNQAHDPARSILAQSLSAEVAAVASRTVYEAVMAGKDMEFMRWMFSLRHITLSGDKMVPQCTVIDADANVASMTRLAEMILMPNGMMPTDVELADLASACMQRLNQRIAYRASR